MKLNQLIECASCLEVDSPTKHGRCATCGSDAIAWVSRLTGGISALPQAKPLPKMCGIDREFLREMGVSA